MNETPGTNSALASTRPNVNCAYVLSHCSDRPFRRTMSLVARVSSAGDPVCGIAWQADRAEFIYERADELIRCGWQGWEFDEVWRREVY